MIQLKNLLLLPLAYAPLAGADDPCDLFLTRTVAADAAALDGLGEVAMDAFARKNAARELAAAGERCDINCTADGGVLRAQMTRPPHAAELQLGSAHYLRKLEVRDPLFGSARLTVGETVSDRDSWPKYADPGAFVRAAEVNAAQILRHGLHPHTLERARAALAGQDGLSVAVRVDSFKPGVSAWLAFSKDRQKLERAKVMAQERGAEVVIEVEFENAPVEAIRAAYAR